MGINIAGVDPGCSGAVAFLGEDPITYEMPTYQITKGRSLRRQIDIPAFIKIFEDNRPQHVYIERVSAQPGNGAASAFSFGWNCAIVEVTMCALKIPFTYVTPQVWKKAMDCPADKDGARQRATQLLPELAHNWLLKRQDGVAEASLLALYGLNKLKMTELAEKYCSTNRLTTDESGGNNGRTEKD